MVKWLTVVAMSQGPLFAYLVWSVSTRRWSHASVALLLNVLLWTLGVKYLVMMGGML